jgi:ABC-type sulfate transport system permease subunit
MQRMTVYEWLVRKSWRVNQRVLKWTLVVLAVVAVPCLFLFTVYAAWTVTRQAPWA